MQDNSKQNFLNGHIKVNKKLSKLNIFRNWKRLITLMNT